MLSIGREFVLEPLGHGPAEAHEEFGEGRVVRRVVAPEELGGRLVHGRVHAPFGLAEALGPFVTYRLAVEAFFRIVPVTRMKSKVSYFTIIRCK